jgi:hypothetical protein
VAESGLQAFVTTNDKSGGDGESTGRAILVRAGDQRTQCS